METNELEAGFQPMAAHFQMLEYKLGNGNVYHFKEDSSGGWFTNYQAVQGLFVSSMWFTPEKTLTYPLFIKEDCLFLFGMDCGNLSIAQNGVATRYFTDGIYLLYNPKKPLQLTFPVHTHTCCTVLILSRAFIENFLKVRISDMEFSYTNIKNWQRALYNTTEVTLVLDQMKWAARSGNHPLFYYECKAGELLSLLIKNQKQFTFRKSNRRYHLSWENEQKVKRIKGLLDENLLHPPTIETLAMSEAISVSKLHRCFKSYYKLSVMDYVKHERMKRALLMLAADDLSIKNIAHQCGYESASKFTAAFKSIYHFTPSQYRMANNV